MLMLHIVSKIKEKPKTLFICVGLGLLLLCIFLNFIYRPYAYSRHLSDFHILESMLILIGFEFVDAFFTKNVDWIDISAACLGGFFTYIIYYYFKTHRPIK